MKGNEGACDAATFATEHGFSRTSDSFGLEGMAFIPLDSYARECTSRSCHIYKRGDDGLKVPEGSMDVGCRYVEIGAREREGKRERERER